jgi:hypothetical protein
MVEKVVDAMMQQIALDLSLAFTNVALILQWAIVSVVKGELLVSDPAYAPVLLGWRLLRVILSNWKLLLG